ncbi:MAG: leucine-rich repeat domain-containing protein [Clostridia bacterium]|nr:leucine-rich repeat domain-containing protein [Clostridia bacterium]
MNSMDIIKGLHFLDDDLISDAAETPEGGKVKGGGGVKSPKNPKPGKSPRGNVKAKSLIIGACAIVAAVAIVFVVLFATGVLTKQTPVYKGMSISSTETTASTASTSSTSVKLSHYGDYNGKNNDIDQNNPYGGDTNTTLEDEYESTLTVTGSSEDIYYVTEGDSVYVTIYFENPDYYKFESFILSDGVNEIHYADYMFEDESDYEQVIVKIDQKYIEVGITSYTISEIKYIDGTEIKDVKMEGDPVVTLGVRSSTTVVTTTAPAEQTTLTSISFDVTISDIYGLITYSGGYIRAVLFDGESIVSMQDLAVGDNSVEFTSLTPNTLYQYSIVAYYDDLTGVGAAVNYIYTNSVYTDAVVLFDGIEVGQEDITFGYTWYTGYSSSSITKLTLTLNGVETVLDTAATYINDLLSNNEYTLTAYYTGLSGEESISLTFTTEAKATPVVEISSLTSTQEEVSYALTITDEDAVGSLTSVTLTLGDTSYTLTDLSGTFENLLSNNTYTLTAVYTYNLNDGEGSQTAVVSQQITTEAKATPEVEITVTDTDVYSLSFGITYTDTDDIGQITAIGLYNGSTLVQSITDLDATQLTFENLSHYTQYTLKVTFKYNLNDGDGEQVYTEEYSLYTDPLIEVSSVAVRNGNGAVSEGDTLVLQIGTNNPDEVTYSSLVINGTTFKVSTIWNGYIILEIVYDNQFAGGETLLTVEYINSTIDGASYSTAVSESNTVSVFFNGALTVDEVSFVRKNDSGEYEATYYAFASEQIYYKISLSNSTEYDITSVTINDTEYSSGDITLSDDYQTVYIPLTTEGSGWQTFNLTSMSYSNESISKSKYVDNTAKLMRLAGDDVVEISSADQLLDVDDCKYYKLTADIDLTDKEWVNLNNDMSGVFDGNGHTISNAGSSETYTNTNINLGLFASVYGIVTNLTIENMFYTVTLNNDNSGSYTVKVGAVAARTGDTAIITNVNVSMYAKVINTNSKTESVCIGGLIGDANYVYITENVEVNAMLACNLAQTTNSILIGGLYGNYFEYNVESVISDVTLDLTVDVVVTSSAGCCVGGLIGTTTGSLTVSDVTVDLTAKVISAGSGMTIGGLIGYIDSGSFNVSNVTLNSDITASFASGDIRIGGVVSNGGEISFYNVTSDMTANVTYDANNTSLFIDVFANGSSHIIDDSCTGVLTYTAKSGTTIYYLVNGFVFSYTGGEYYLTGYSGSETDIILPDDINGSQYTIASYAFQYSNSSLTSITITGGVKALNDYAFAYCSAELIWADSFSVTGISSEAFKYYQGTNLNMPEGVTSVGRFAAMTTLVSVTIPNSATSIEWYTFENCTSLETIVIGSGITGIDDYAFIGCTSFKTVYYNGTEAQWNKIVIGENGNEYLEAATVYFYSEEEPTQDGNYWHYVDGIVTVW